MKLSKKIMALALALVMTLGLGVSAFAAEKTYKIDITNAHAGHTYEAYQVFDGDLSSDGSTLSNITWGKGVNSTALLTALKADETIGDEFTDAETAEDVANVVKTYTNDSGKLIAFTKVVGNNLSSTVAGTSTDTTAAGAASHKYTITGLDAGYYIVKDKDDSSLSGDDAYTRYMIQVVKNQEVKAKEEVPTIDKVIDENSGVKANTASIGDKVPFKVTGSVPDMTGYDKYFYVVNDELSEGLTFNDDVAITIGGTPLTEDVDYTVTVTGQKVKIVFNNFIDYADQENAAIVITYSATLNEKADLSTTGNKNDVTLRYSNNPNVTPKGDNEPTDDEKDKVTGETPKSTTKTYTTGVKVTKVDGQDTSKTLTGAKFEISGTKMDIVLVNKTIYETSATGTYYLLKDGTYTNEAPTTLTEDQYDSTTVKYAKVETVDKKTNATPITAAGYVNGSGVITFEGLAAGTYQIKELVAPDGYNLLKEPIEVVINANATASGVTWTVTSGGNTLSAESNLYQLEVQNNQGNVLPSTGGIGTTIFYIAGTVLVLGAAVVLIARKRMDRENA